MVIVAPKHKTVPEAGDADGDYGISPSSWGYQATSYMWAGSKDFSQIGNQLGNGGGNISGKP